MPLSHFLYQAKASGSPVVPGAENVGQAQILSEFSKPFTLEGLFGAADAGAFGERTADVQMNVDEDDDEDQEPMQEDGFAPFRLLFHVLS